VQLRQVLEWNNHPDLKEAEANYVVERLGFTQADGLLWLLRHITGIATKRDDSAGVLGPNIILDGSRSGEEAASLPGLFQSTTCALGLEGKLPAPEAPLTPFKLNSYRWQQHCRGLYQTPIAT
jgi:hypothetical protein